MKILRYWPIALSFVFTACGAESSSTSQEATIVTSNSFVCNGMDAREVLSQIAQNGAVLTNRREAVFYFYGPENKLAAFESELQKLEFTVRPTNAEPGRIATVTRVVDEIWLAEIMPKICALIAAHGIEYDGWEASIPEAQSN